jgi:hypothetical protein
MQVASAAFDTSFQLPGKSGFSMLIESKRWMAVNNFAEAASVPIITATLNIIHSGYPQKGRICAA